MQAAITTITTMTTMSTDAGALLRLLAWLSPGFPTGGYAYSHGLEWAVEAHEIHDGETLRIWIEDLLHHGTGWSDAILLRHAHAAATDIDALEEIAEFALAAVPCRERYFETIGQGNAFVAAAASWHPELLTRIGDVPYSVSVGALAGAHGIDVDAACAGLLQAFATNLISAAVRLVPLGQSTGLAVLAQLQSAIIAVTDKSRGANLEKIGGACFRSDLAAMRHETQYTRLFRS
jgi:urease accessory protein